MTTQSKGFIQIPLIVLGVGVAIALHLVVVGGIYLYHKYGPERSALNIQNTGSNLSGNAVAAAEANGSKSTKLPADDNPFTADEKLQRLITLGAANREGSAAVIAPEIIEVPTTESVMKAAQDAFKTWKETGHWPKSFDYGTWLLQAEAADQILTHRKFILALRTYKRVKDQIKTVLEQESDKSKLRELTRFLMQNYLGEYWEEKGLLSDVLLEKHGNCSARSKLFAAVVVDLELSFPDYLFGLQEYIPHVQPVAYVTAPTRKEVDLISGVNYTKYGAAIIRPQLFMFSWLEQRKFETIVSFSDLVLLEDRASELGNEVVRAFPDTNDNIGGSGRAKKYLIGADRNPKRAFSFFMEMDWESDISDQDGLKGGQAADRAAGFNLQRFDRLPVEQQRDILGELMGVPFNSDIPSAQLRAVFKSNKEELLLCGNTYRPAPKFVYAEPKGPLGLGLKVVYGSYNVVGTSFMMSDGNTFVPGNERTQIEIGNRELVDQLQKQLPRRALHLLFEAMEQHLKDVNRVPAFGELIAFLANPFSGQVRGDRPALTQQEILEYVNAEGEIQGRFLQCRIAERLDLRGTAVETLVRALIQLRQFTKQNAASVIKYLDEKMSIEERLAVFEDLLLLQNPFYLPKEDREKFSILGWKSFRIQAIVQYFWDEISLQDAEGVRDQTFLTPLVEELLEGTKYLVKIPLPQSGQLLPVYVAPSLDLSRGQSPGSGDLSTKVETPVSESAIRVSPETFWALVLAQPASLLENPVYKVAVLKKISSFHLETIEEKFYTRSWLLTFSTLAAYGYLDSLDWAFSPRAIYVEKFGARNLKYFEILSDERVGSSSLRSRGGALPEAVANIVLKTYQAFVEPPQTPEQISASNPAPLPSPQPWLGDIKLIDAPAVEPAPQQLSNFVEKKDIEKYCPPGGSNQERSVFQNRQRMETIDSWWVGNRFLTFKRTYEPDLQKLHVQIYLKPESGADIETDPAVPRMRAFGGDFYFGTISLKDCAP